VELWQVVLLVFFALLPIVLMLDFWGEERVDARGAPKPRAWPRDPRRGGDVDAAASHDEATGAVPH
jgi:hypothetical protein